MNRFPLDVTFFVTSDLNIAMAVLCASVASQTARQCVFVSLRLGETPLPGQLNHQPQHHEENHTADGQQVGVE
jgi:hypothetical protein